MWKALSTSNIIFNLLLISLPKLRIKEPASPYTKYNTTDVDCRQYKKPYNNKNRKLRVSTSEGTEASGRLKLSRPHGFVPSRGSPQDCTRTALSRPFRHRFGPVQAVPTMMMMMMFSHLLIFLKSSPWSQNRLQ